MQAGESLEFHLQSQMGGPSGLSEDKDAERIVGSKDYDHEVLERDRNSFGSWRPLTKKQNKTLFTLCPCPEAVGAVF